MPEDKANFYIEITERGTERTIRAFERTGSASQKAGRKIKAVGQQQVKTGNEAAGALEKWAKWVLYLASLYAFRKIMTTLETLEKKARDFRKEAALVGNLDAPLRRVREELKKFDPILGSQTTLMKDYFRVWSGGATQMAASINVTRDAARTAFAEGADLVAVTRAGLKLWNIYGSELRSTTQAFEMLSEAAKYGDTNLQEIAASVSELLPMSKAMNQAAGESLGILALLTRVSGSTGTAVTNLASLMRSFANNTKEAQDAAEKLGINWNADELAARGLAGYVKYLKQRMEESNLTYGEQISLLRDMTGRIQALNALLALLGDQFENIDEAVQTVSNSYGVLDPKFQRMEQAIGVHERWANTWENIQIQLGEGLVPTMEVFTGVLQGLSGIIPGLIKYSLSLITVLFGMLIVNKLTAAWIAYTTAVNAAVPASWRLALVLSDIGIILKSAFIIGGITFAIVLISEIIGAITNAVDEMTRLTNATKDWLKEQEKVQGELQAEIDEFIRLKKTMGETADEKKRLTELTEKLTKRFPELRREIQGATDDLTALADALSRASLEEQRTLMRAAIARTKMEIDLLKKTLPQDILAEYERVGHWVKGKFTIKGAFLNEEQAHTIHQLIDLQSKLNLLTKEYQVIIEELDKLPRLESPLKGWTGDTKELWGVMKDVIDEIERMGGVTHLTLEEIRIKLKEVEKAFVDIQERPDVTKEQIASMREGYDLIVEWFGFRIKSLTEEKDKLVDMMAATSDYTLQLKALNIEYGQERMLILNLTEPGKLRNQLLEAAAAEFAKNRNEIMQLSPLYRAYNAAIKVGNQLMEAGLDLLKQLNEAWEEDVALSHEILREYGKGHTFALLELKTIQDRINAYKRLYMEGLIPVDVLSHKMWEETRNQILALEKANPLTESLGLAVRGLAQAYEMMAEILGLNNEKLKKQNEELNRTILILDQLSNTMQIMGGVFAAFGVPQFSEFFKGIEGMQKGASLWAEGTRLADKGQGAAAWMAKFNAVLTIVAAFVSTIGNLIKLLQTDYTKRSIEGYGRELGIHFSKAFCDQFKSMVDELRAEGFTKFGARATARALLIPQMIEEAGGQLTQTQWALMERDIHWAFEEMRKEGYTLEQTMAKLGESMFALAEQIELGHVAMTDSFRAMVSMLFQTGQATDDFLIKIKAFITEADLAAWATETARGISRGTVSLGEFTRQFLLLNQYAREFGFNIEGQLEHIIAAAKGAGFTFEEVAMAMRSQLEMHIEDVKELKKAWQDAAKQLREYTASLKEKRFDIYSSIYKLYKPGGAIYEAQQGFIDLMTGKPGGGGKSAQDIVSERFGVQEKLLGQVKGLAKSEAMFIAYGYGDVWKELNEKILRGEMIDWEVYEELAAKMINGFAPYLLDAIKLLNQKLELTQQLEKVAEGGGGGVAPVPFYYRVPEHEVIQVIPGGGEEGEPDDSARALVTVIPEAIYEGYEGLEKLWEDLRAEQEKGFIDWATFLEYKERIPPEYAMLLLSAIDSLNLETALNKELEELASHRTELQEIKKQARISYEMERTKLQDMREDINRMRNMWDRVAPLVHWDLTNRWLEKIWNKLPKKFQFGGPVTHTGWVEPKYDAYVLTHDMLRGGGAKPNMIGKIVIAQTNSKGQEEAIAEITGLALQVKELRNQIKGKDGKGISARVVN